MGKRKLPLEEERAYLELAQAVRRIRQAEERAKRRRACKNRKGVANAK